MSNADRAGFTFFVLACLFLAFLGGSYIVLARVFPYQYFNDAYRAGNALIAQHAIQNRYTQTDQWRPAPTDLHGTTLHDAGRAYNGYTLYTSGSGTYASLIDMQGHEVHRWSLPYRAVFDTAPDGGKPQPDNLMYWRKALMYPNGDLLADYIAAGDTPWGYGLVKVDADSNIIWRYKAATHHDIGLTPDGRVLALTQEFSSQRYAGFGLLGKPFLEDFLVVLDGETGEQLRKISIFKAFYQSRFRPLLTAIPGYALGDPTHTNSVQYIGKALAKRFAPAKGHGGQVLLSFRFPSVVALLDLKSGRMTWALKGSWLGQHCARALPDGNFTLFDNYGNYHPRNISRVIEVDPVSHAIVWAYHGDAAHPFNSHIRGAAETLPNGNRLVTESDYGRLFEVTPDHRIVWEFVNPVRGGDQHQFIPVVSSGARFAPDTLDPGFRATLAPH